MQNNIENTPLYRKSLLIVQCIDDNLNFSSEKRYTQDIVDFVLQIAEKAYEQGRTDNEWRFLGSRTFEDFKKTL